MKANVHRRLALFQAEYPLTFQTANGVIMLAEAGYDVELFLLNMSSDLRYVEFEKLLERPRVQIHELYTVDRASSGASPRRNVDGRPTVAQRLKTCARAMAPELVALHTQMRRLFRTARHGWRLLWRDEEDLLPREIMGGTLELMGGRHYRCLIGIEKKGLIWAGQIAERLHAPLIYYNTELYTEDHWRVRMGKSIYFKRLRLAECRYHGRAVATIIQDPDRAQILFRDNGVSIRDATILYVPGSLLGGPYRRRSTFLHEMFGLPSDRRVILYFGQIWEKRYVVELAQMAQGFPEDWVLVMHGWEYEGAAEKIKAVDRRGRVLLSLKWISSERIQEVVASADVGLAFYSAETENERLTAFASEKIAMYMQCGVPFIAFDYPGFRALAREDKCGLVIRALEELPEAVAKILGSHDEFRGNAYEAFRKHYDFAGNFAPVIDAIGRL